MKNWTNTFFTKTKLDRKPNTRIGWLSKRKLFLSKWNTMNKNMEWVRVQRECKWTPEAIRRESSGHLLIGFFQFLWRNRWKFSFFIGHLLKDEDIFLNSDEMIKTVVFANICKTNECFYYGDDSLEVVLRKESCSLSKKKTSEWNRLNWMMNWCWSMDHWF